MLPQNNTQTLSTEQLLNLVGALAIVSAAGGFIAISALSQTQTAIVPAQAQAVTPLIASAAANLLQTDSVNSAISVSNASTPSDSMLTSDSFVTDGIALKQ